MEEQLAPKAENNPLEESTAYQIKNKTFIVTPIFNNGSKETLAAILLRLMKSDTEKE